MIRSMTVVAVLALLVLFAVAKCDPGRTAPRTSFPETSLTVFAAASLTEAFSSMEAAFEARHAGVDVVLNLAGSQQLVYQLQHGAPADVFASADRRQMERVVSAGRIEAAAPRPFAGNRLVAVVPRENPGNLMRLQDLAEPGRRLVLAADEVPAGHYARRFLMNAARDASFSPDYAESVLARTVSFEPTVRAVLTKVVLGEADAGIVYRSDAVAVGTDRIRVFEIPVELNVEAVYPIAPLSDATAPELAEAFIAFVLSPVGQEIMRRHGFAPAPAA